MKSNSGETPKIFVRINTGEWFDGMHRVRCLMPRSGQGIEQTLTLGGIYPYEDGTIIVCINTLGDYHGVYVETVRRSEPGEYMFFINQAAELIYILFPHLMRLSSVIEIDPQMLREVQNAIPTQFLCGGQ